MSLKIKNTIALVSCFLMVLGFQWCSLDRPFFWDTIQLGAAHATYYWSTQFSTILLPESIDSGHIPSFGMFLALVWEIFGRTLIASHLCILPFSIGIVWQLWQLCRQFIVAEFAGVALCLIMIDPSLLSQITLVSPDVPLVFFFLLSVNAVLKNRTLLLLCGILLLFMTSMRGMMLSICILFLDLYRHIDLKKTPKQLLSILLKRSIIYIPALLVFVIFSGYHYAEKGWIGYHRNSPWAKCFEAVNFKGFLYNIGIYGWRLIDFGRVGVWSAFFILLLLYRKVIFKEKEIRILGYFSAVLLLILPLNMLWAKNLLAPRYFIPIYLTFSLFCAAILFSKFVAKNVRLALAALWFICIVSGNFWVYPRQISEGWDATLAHVPYYKLREQALAYLDNEQLPYSEVQSFFPNTAAIDLIDLNGDARKFQNFDGKGRYVLDSNIFNVNETDYNSLIRHYKVVKRFEHLGVHVVIYEKLQ
ncbi:MAG: hypothetical protein H7199_06440 [Burkholderiales bacterium]|nr:hypothetical protein [Flavobacterium sp.]